MRNRGAPVLVLGSVGDFPSPPRHEAATIKLAVNSRRAVRRTNEKRLGRRVIGGFPRRWEEPVHTRTSLTYAETRLDPTQRSLRDYSPRSLSGRAGSRARGGGRR